VPSEDEAVYTAFLAQWKVAQAQRAPGEPTPPDGANAACFDCVSSRGNATCTYPADRNCTTYTACVERNCLNAEQGYPESFLECVQSCLPADGGICKEEWSSYVTCSAEACSTACIK
jgi:hypothetical protein